MIEDITLRATPEEAADVHKLRQLLESHSKGRHKVNDLKIIRRSIDARKHPVMLNLAVRVATGDDPEVPSIFKETHIPTADDTWPAVIIVGAGPAGLFAALEALIRGLRPVVIERGFDVDTRRLDIATINREKKINPQSNYCFGEGGAGTFSDGKLFTRSKKRGSVERVLQLFVQHGADPSILIEAHPHIGSDRLPHVVKNIRNTIISHGGEVHFGTQMKGLLIDHGDVTGISTDKGDFRGAGVILAIGHSAHDTVRSLYAQHLPMEAKGFAAGVRLEHPQTLVDSIQYHNRQGRGKWLPPAEYSFVSQVEGRGVYSFCMCPGGVIVPAASSDREMVVNGMSASGRSGRWANSGMVVELHPGDIPKLEGEGPLGMLELQERIERSIFEAGPGNMTAPAQRMTDFTNGKLSSTLAESSYAPGLYSADFNKLLPPFIARRLAQGFRDFGRKAHGFLTPEAQLIGFESRTSSPVRMVRDPETLASSAYANVYPAGEGAGYAGGIVSSAIDGMRCAEQMAQSIRVHQTE